MSEVVVTGPDGSTFRFPEGTPAETITGAMQSHYGGPSPAKDGEKPNTLVDMAKSAGIGVAKGAIGMAGMVGDLNNIVTAGSDWLASKVASPESLKKVQELRDANRSPISQPSSQEIQRSVEGVTGDFYKPQTTAGKYAESVGTMVPAVALGPGSILRKAGQAVGSGVGSEAAGQATEGTVFEPYARVGGAIVGGALPDIVRRAVTPNPISPERQRLLDTLNQEGVNSLTAGQRTGNKTLQYAESILGDAPGAGQGATRIQQEGQRQFTEAAMRRAGAGPNAAPEVLADNQVRLGAQFDAIAARNSVAADPQLAHDLGTTLREYDRVLPAAQREIVGNLATDIVDRFTAGGGRMAGADYQAARSRLSRMANSARVNDPDFAEALRGLRDTLDNGFRRSVNPTDAALLDQTRTQYAAQKVLEKTASKAGEAAAEGQVVPSALRNAVASGNNRGAYARGEGQFAELARAGSGIMAPLPNSGTAQRNLITLLATGGGGVLGGVSSGGLASAAGAATGMAAPGAIGRALMSRPVQGYLGNQLIGQPDARVRDAARLSNLVNALLAAKR